MPAPLPPPPPCESLPEDELARVKINFITAAYAASPMRVVERKPLLSVTATAASTMAVTVLLTSLLTRAGGGFFASIVGLGTTLMRSNFVGPAVSSFISSKIAQPDSPPQQQQTATAS
ncbi:MAG TPA: hypothetical protein VF595_00955 [Tepidisphaeraceae bacterium]|jgi:hypothetical protein